MRHGADLDSLDGIHETRQQFTCWHCGTELIWGADFDMEDINDGEESEYDFYSTFTCPYCDSYTEVFHKCQ